MFPSFITIWIFWEKKKSKKRKGKKKERIGTRKKFILLYLAHRWIKPKNIEWNISQKGQLTADGTFCEFFNVQHFFPAQFVQFSRTTIFRTKFKNMHSKTHAESSSCKWLGCFSFWFVHNSTVFYSLYTHALKQLKYTKTYGKTHAHCCVDCYLMFRAFQLEMTLRLVAKMV